MADTQINVGMNVAGVVTGAETIKRSMRDIGASTREAGKGSAAIGDGMAGSAQKVESATKNMIQSIQRQTAAIEAGDKASRQYQESLARMRGIDTAALKPYLDQLDAAKLKQSEAAKSAESFAQGMGAVKIAAVAMAASAGAVAVFAKSIIDAADGLNDLSQRVGISVRELGKYQLAAEQSGSSIEAIAKGVKGLAKNMVENGDALRKAGIDATSADGAMRQLADMFAAMPDGIEKTTLATTLFGKAGMDLIPMLNLGSEGLREAAVASAEYAEQMAIIAPLSDAFNDKVAELALSSKTAGAIMVNEFLPSLNQIASGMVSAKDSANSFAQLMGGVVNVVVQTAAVLISDVVFVLKGVGTEVGGISAQLVALAKLDFKGAGAISSAMKEDADNARKELDQWQSDLINGVSKANSAASDAYAKRQGFSESSSGRGAALLRALGGDGEAKKAIADANRELEAQAKLIAELAGLTGSFADDWERMGAMYANGKLNLEGLTQAQADLLAKQPAIKAQIDAQKRAVDDAAKAMDTAAKASRAYFAELAKGDDALIKANTKLQEENELIGLSEEAKSRLILSRMDNAIAIEQEAFALLNLQNSSEIEIATTERRIALMREQRSLTANGIVAREAQTAKAEWTKTSDSIRDNLTDAFLSAVDNGKSLFVNLRDSIVNMFKNMVLRPIIQGVMAPIAGALTGSLFGTAANAATGQIATQGLLGAAGQSTISAGISAGVNAFATGWSAAAYEASMGAAFVGPSVAGAGGAMGAGASTYGALAGIGPAGWAAMAVLAVAAIASGRGETRMGAQYGNNGDGTGANLLSGPSGGEIGGEAARKLLEGTQLAINDTLKKVGSAATLAGFQGGLESSENGKGFTYAGGSLSTGAKFGITRDTPEWYMNNRGSKTAEQAMAEYVIEMRQSVLQALQVATDIPKTIADQLKGIDVDKLSADALTALEATVQKTIADVDAFNVVVATMPFAQLKNLGFDAASGLIAAAGGLEKLGTDLGTYYANFYTAEEQRAQTLANINTTLKDTGISFTAQTLSAANARDTFRDLVEAQDLTTESGRKTWAALMSVNGAFAGLTESAETLAKAAADAAAQAAEKAAQAAAQALKESRQSAMDAVTRAIDAEKKRIQVTRDLAAEQVSALKSVFDTLKASVASLYGSVDSTRDLRAAQGRDFIAQALATAQASGYLPDQTALADAISAATAGTDAAFYATQADANVAKLVLAGQLKKLQDLSGTQLTSAEQAVDLAQSQLDDLDSLLTLSQQQLDAANGIDISVMSVTDAITRLQEALKPGSTTPGAPKTGTNAGGFTIHPYGTPLPEGMYDKYNSVPVPGAKYTEYYTLGGYGTWGTAITDTAEIDRLDQIASVIDDYSWADADKSASAHAIYDQAMQYGVSMQEIANAAGYNIKDVKALFDSAGIPMFAAGTNRIPQDMLAMVHQGEAIIPAAYNPANGGIQQNTARLESLVQTLTAEVQRLQTLVITGNDHTERSANALEGQQQRPILVEVAA